MGKYAMITVAHDIDCSDTVVIGDYSSLAGYHCTILTHSLNLVRGRFVTGSVVIGDHTAVMSDSVLLSGTKVPARSIVSAGSVVNTPLTAELTFYSGNPAESVRSLPDSLGFFHRGEEGYPDFATASYWGRPLGTCPAVPGLPPTGGKASGRLEEWRDCLRRRPARPISAPPPTSPPTPDRPAVITACGRVVTFAQLEERSSRLAQALFAHGLRPGDHVAVLLPNDHRTHEVAFGLQRSGLYYTHGQHAPGRRGGGVHRQRLRRPHAHHRRPRLAPAGGGAGPPDARRRPAPDDRATPSRPGHTSYDEFVAGFPGEPLAEELEGFPMLYSSGTTGHPKGIRRPLTGEPFGTERHARADARQIMGFGPGDVYLSSGPALPLRPAGVVHDGAAHGRDGGGDGALRPRGAAWRSSSGTGSRTPSSSRRCSCAC